MSTAELEGGLIFAGLVGMIDPPRRKPDKPLKNAGLPGCPVMITGDHQGTAAIAREVSIAKKTAK